MKPLRVPIGLRLGQVSRVVSRAFDDALDEAGGSLPVWLILLNLKIRRPANQRELAEAIGLREATLTHHLNAMDTRGLVTRRRDETNRRIHVVELTADGEAAFIRLQQAAVAFNARLCDGLAESDLDVLDSLLGRLSANAGGPADGAMPWAGLAERPSLRARPGQRAADRELRQQRHPALGPGPYHRHAACPHPLRARVQHRVGGFPERAV
jgi:MarR family transcriptional regulator, transcriptional regulator for hemolysin